MYLMSRRGESVNTPTAEFFCDTAADLDLIDPHYISLGSVALVLNNGSDFELYIADSNKTWKKL